jgi:hypothetical protein
LNNSPQLETKLSTLNRFQNSAYSTLEYALSLQLAITLHPKGMGYLILYEVSGGGGIKIIITTTAKSNDELHSNDSLVTSINPEG